MATQPATFIKAIMSDQPQRPIEDLPVEIRSMILSKVSFAKENAVKDWLNLALTSHQFYKIVVSRSFCVQYLCNHPNPSMTLYRHLPGFYEPKAWVARYQHHLQTADLARTLFEIRRPRFEAHLTSIQQGELTEKLEHVFCTAYALLDLITSGRARVPVVDILRQSISRDPTHVKEESLSGTSIMTKILG
ncbi:hypothetical protein OHC33_009694 [Knufia fluminis]|uniref:F-box domain-containing protein n=1 Tax=Knufia fluminis TaxID=191047 RepID=A0AAN8I4N5_9EURO|nr:hypothetical protein OHC33_009694 [Knufia fluminis]